MDAVGAQVWPMSLGVAVGAQKLALACLLQNKVPRPVGQGTHVQLKILAPGRVVKLERREVRRVPTVCAGAAEHGDETNLPEHSALLLRRVDLMPGVG